MPDIIDELGALSDAELSKKLGFADKVDTFKKDLATAKGLTGEKRAKVVTTMTRIFSPDNYEIQDVHRVVERAAAPEKDKSKECAEFVNSCGCTDYID